MKLTYRRLVIFAILLAASVGFGFAFDAIATVIERHSHPIREEYAAQIKNNAEEFAVPEAILWAIACVGSDFESNHVSDNGAIGLMQLTPERFESVCSDLLGETDVKAGMIYDPATNLRAGAALVSELHLRYGAWDTVYAAYFIGEGQVDAWLSNESLVNELNRLQSIPDDDTEDFVNDVKDAVETYQKLYFNP